MSARRSSRDRAPFVLLTGGKGGVGKTTIAANLAVELAQSGQRVLLCDLDLGLANLDVFLRLSTNGSIEDALSGRAELRDCIVSGPGGVDVLPASSGTAAMGRLEAERRAELLTGVLELARGYDLVLADSAAGIGPDVLDVAAAADRVLVVTTPEVAALTDAYGLIKAVTTRASEGGLDLPTPEVVVNRVTGPEEAERTVERLRNVCEQFLARAPRCAGWLSSSDAIATAAALQRPFALDPRCVLPRSCLRRVGARLTRLARVPAGVRSPRVALAETR